VSGEDLLGFSIVVSVHKKDGTIYKFNLCDVEGLHMTCEFTKDYNNELTYSFHQPWPYTTENFESVTFTLPPSSQSPKGKQLAEEKRSQLVAEQKRNQGLADIRYAKAKAAEDAAEKARIRAACATIYRNTADMKVKDLTVKEEQQVRACQALGLY
jgi:hypothetical protein